MLKRTVATVVLTIASATAAFAADLGGAPRQYSIKDEPVYVRPPTWAGFYVGLQGGYDWGNASHRYDDGSPGGSSDPSGWMGGAHLGYNFQRGMTVFGAEVDFEGSDASGDYGTAVGTTSAGYTGMNWQGSLRARLGFAADRTLFYVTAGWAFGDADFAGGPLGGPLVGYSKSMNGWTVGGGIEHMLTNNVSLRAEYRYTDWGSTSGSVDPALLGTNMKVDQDSHALRAGISYHF